MKAENDTHVIDAADDPLSSDERGALLAEIGLVCLLLGRDLSRTVGADVADAPLPPDAVSPLERLGLLEVCWPRIARAIAQIPSLSPGRIVADLDQMPLRQARGGPYAARAAASHPAAAAAWAASQGAATGRRSGGEARIPDRRSRPTHDTPNNRFAVWLLARLEREARVLAALADFCGETRTARQARTLRDDIARWQHHPFYREVRRLIGPGSFAMPSDRAAGAPPHRALYDAWRTLNRRPRLDWADSPLLRLPAAEPWHLYEIWCLLSTAAALRQLGWRATGSDLIRIAPSGLRLTLNAGQASHIRFARRASERLSLCYRPWFASVTQRMSWRESAARSARGAEGDLSSRTHVMQPDIALERNGRLWLLDAKYRRYQLPHETETDRFALRTDSALLDDLNKMHAYRDAIVRGDKPVVEAAWCLYPGQMDQGPELIAYPTGVSSRPFGSAGIGALRLRPGSGRDLLARLLGDWETRRV